MNKDKLVGVGVVVALGLGLLGVFSGNAEPSEKVVERVIEKQFSAASGPDHYQRQYFHEGFAYGSAGTAFATTTSASATFNVTDLAENDYVTVTPDVGAVTLTLPATTTAGFINVVGKETGSTRIIHVYNATTTTGADSIVTWAAGTGIDLQEDEGGTVTQNGLEMARIVLIRKADSDVAAWVEVGQVGD